ncbi:response regulator receiver protein [Rufibacter radiotolerans]|uniref:Response regulator receiver protein n=1 Tax=Rufibacter radiotolerans TaxID=1379910 RepID=A0A0H4VMW4_9BACT|nr:response regulator [Rufibacter radiotolerans]AKQ46663.1 response regulator receiver protein [Rufibacter radiotolerans]
MKRLNLILLVDDDETTNYLNKRLLTRLEIADHIEVATNGEEALQFLKDAIAKGEPLPELIFLDIKMPVMDGFEFLEQYHQLPETAQNSMVVMMLTSSASFYDLERLKKYRAVQRHISKPLEEAHVREIMEEHFQ